VLPIAEYFSHLEVEAALTRQADDHAAALEMRRKRREIAVVHECRKGQDNQVTSTGRLLWIARHQERPGSDFAPSSTDGSGQPMMPQNINPRTCLFGAASVDTQFHTGLCRDQAGQNV
jgi:hypothetical protein